MKCKTCEGKMIAGGAAITPYTCGHCFQRFLYGNTATPRLCSECSVKFGRCERCLEPINEAEE